ncbi:hypothetical protein WDD9_001487 [Paenibacillus melissococcoides]|nr:hypothetical protein [Paenibacillus melissococcoides]CAH8704292.1 hypothetical protein HTL2_000525 [Paenibacillus melissococcoides]CAH8707064.1 hypothetical protein WDD9_001487 [Paenibacillus melissococcoides]
MPQLILNIDMNTFLGFADRDLLLPRMPDRLDRDGQVHTAGGLSPLAISSSAAPSDWLRCKNGLIILSTLDGLNAK